MAATDQTYRNQKTLDVVFAVSCILMLLSIIGMFMQDYNRDFKKIQRTFRDVDEALTERAMLDKLPPADKLTEATEAVAAAREQVDQIRKENKTKLESFYARKAKQEAAFQSIKADYDSLMSLYNIDMEKVSEESDGSFKESLRRAATKRKQDVEKLGQSMTEAQMALDATNRELNEKLVPQKEAEQKLSKAEDELKKLASDFDRFAKLTAQKRWTKYDFIRALPILDAFASPVKIQQYTLEEYPIDYAFKYVTRYDRCTTCHLAMERSAFDKVSLARLTPDFEPFGRNLLDVTRRRRSEQEDLSASLDIALPLLRERAANGEDLGYDPNNIPAKIPTKNLSLDQVREFAAHPRLDLFVDANSPHPAEKFGCTSCHSGQGSSTDFVNATHTPNSAEQRDYWIHGQGWQSIHFWDYPMLPKRFLESGCLKCHHNVTDLAREAGKVEFRRDIEERKDTEGTKTRLAEVPREVLAPGSKLVRGYNLVREFGCFGCHEIPGFKGTRQMGPDLRLEPNPPLESLPAAERAKILADTANPPGTMRKVGPSLYRLSEKTHQEWTRRWIDKPRTFRPTTKMPHFYNVSNNIPEVLPEDQKSFPTTEVYSIAYYLHYESDRYLEGKDKDQRDLANKIDALTAKQKGDGLTDKEKQELTDLTRQHEEYQKNLPTPLQKEIRDWENKLVQLKPLGNQADKEQLKRGRTFFTEKGCLACHMHEGTTKPDSEFVATQSRANFGPDLTRLKAKLIAEQDGSEGGHRWLVQWILNPNQHHPRTRMPVTFLSSNEASDVAAWLLSQDVTDWKQPDVPKPSSEALAQLAKVYLLKAPGMTRADVDEVLQQSGNGRKGLTDVKHLAPEADERELLGPLDDSKLQWYIGRKAITRQGCFGCHNIPGFASAKPIGTQLNDWGKKDPERLAFEDILDYMKKHYFPVSSTKDVKEPEGEEETGKQPYDSFFMEALEHRHREGFLHQKLVEPRSYDHNRLRVWDDRLRMPQFRFARDELKVLEGESPQQAEIRQEADAREAVMTFVLGLVAEPVPAKYLYRPNEDKLAEVKGRQVLDKFNCAGCHEIRPGMFEFRQSPDVTKRLGTFYDLSQTTAPADHVFPDHNAWVGALPTKPDRFVAHGIPDTTNDDPQQIILRLVQAFRFMGTDGQPKDIPAGSAIGIPLEDLLSRMDTFGGTLSYLLIPHLAKRDPVLFKEAKTARAALPPPLIREGEKVQPSWLFQFLRNPFRIRPLTVLRMPRFNMSDEEAMTLVNYFAAVDKQNNPSQGLIYPYSTIPQKDDGFWHGKTQSYVARLGEDRIKDRSKGLHPVWELMLREQLVDLEARHRQAEESAKSAKDDAKKEIEKRRDDLKKQIDSIRAQVEKKEFKELDTGWKEQDAYAADAFRMLANYNNACLSCHQVGNLLPSQAQGPPLQLSAERLRPEWTLRWIANPERLISYPTPMPQNFAKNQVDAKGLSTVFTEYTGSPREQVEAVRDLLMILPRAADMPVNRYYHSPIAGEGEKK